MVNLVFEAVIEDQTLARFPAALLSAAHYPAFTTAEHQPEMACETDVAPTTVWSQLASLLHAGFRNFRIFMAKNKHQIRTVARLENIASPSPACRQVREETSTSSLLLQQTI